MLEEGQNELEKVPKHMVLHIPFARLGDNSEQTPDNVCVALLLLDRGPRSKFGPDERRSAAMPFMKGLLAAALEFMVWTIARCHTCKQHLNYFELLHEDMKAPIQPGPIDFSAMTEPHSLPEAEPWYDKVAQARRSAETNSAPFSPPAVGDATTTHYRVTALEGANFHEDSDIFLEIASRYFDEEPAPTIRNPTF
eukprot:6477402-Amphidinium_carterae.1